jgi:hypothetical protein
MKRKLIVGSVALFLGISSCIKHEIIPPPEPKVDLDCHFRGFINGTDTELTENVVGYYLETNKTKIILPSPQPSSAVYYAEMKTNQNLRSVKVSLGSVAWDATASDDPSLDMFNSFMNANLTPTFSNNAAAGFEFTFRDINGVVWRSKEDSPDPMDVTFSNLSQESDASGDYNKFTVVFSCTVYHTYLAGEQDPDNPGQVLLNDLEKSIPISNATFKAWFKR